MKLKPLTRSQCQEARKWRNNELQFLRTPYPLTVDMQDKFYDSVINNRSASHRYYAVVDNTKIFMDEPIDLFIGMVGLTNIEWENGNAEISIILDPNQRGKKYGAKAVDLLLEEAFNTLRLEMVWGEVYNCGNRKFWEKITDKYNEYRVDLKERKFYNGIRHDSMWFCIRRAKWSVLSQQEAVANDSQERT